jgi:hypothetical protein
VCPGFTKILGPPLVVALHHSCSVGKLVPSIRCDCRQTHMADGRSPVICQPASGLFRPRKNAWTFNVSSSNILFF